ncbi:MAG: response regulator transcription factor [Burkholderiaceae bacterium]
MPESSEIRLLVVDDQPLIRRGLAMMLGAEQDVTVVGQAGDGREAIDAALAHRPDVVVMDLRMPGVGGVAATREICTRLPATKVVVLTTYDDDELVFAAIQAGAQAYLLKDASESDVLSTVRAVHRGESNLSPSIARKVMARFRALAGEVDHTTAAGPAPRSRASIDEESLTEREARILALIAQGLTNRQIAPEVFLAEGTVKNYVSRIMEKLHARSRTELAVRAVGRRP